MAIRIFELEEWKKNGFTDTNATRWMLNGFNIEEAKKWVTHGFSIQSALDFQKKGLTPTAVKRMILEEVRDGLF